MEMSAADHTFQDSDSCKDELKAVLYDQTQPVL